MENQKQQALERLKQANNVLVTVSQNPSVDQLSAAIGFTLFLTKLEKHATAVFSGEVPSTIEFLKPGQTIEKNTDSLRDFIISLDKSKADKLRYKVEDNHVKVFITPYRTSITEADLEFSQGDFNVDVVVALGVSEQKDLDQAITAHGRILHDATVISVTTGAQSALGAINWVNDKASSLSEMLAELSESLQSGNMDNQMATAFLTGIVAETARFSNEKTTPATMTISAKLMAAGANQQLVASELQKDAAPAPAEAKAEATGHDGTLQIGHPTGDQSEEKPAEDIDINDQGEISLPDVVQDQPAEEEPTESEEDHEFSRAPITEPPQMGGVLTASGRPEETPPVIDPLAGDQTGPLLTHDAPAPAEMPEQTDEEPLQPSFDLPSEMPARQMAAPVEEPVEDKPEEAQEAPILEPLDTTPAIELPETPIEEETGPGTLADLERSVGAHTEEVGEEKADFEVNSADANADGTVDLDEARNAVMAAMSQAPADQPLPPIEALNAQPIDLNPPQPAAEPDFSLPPGLIPDEAPVDNTAASVEDPTAPPPVPPPMMPPMPGFDPSVQLPPLPSDDQNDQQQPPVNPQAGDPSNPFGLPPA